MRPALLFLWISTVLAAVSAQEIPDPRAAIRTALQAELEDFSRADWNHKPASWSGGLFSPPVGPALTEYRRHLTEIAGWEGGPIWHQVGSLPWTTRAGKIERLGVNVFFPEGTSRGTLLFVNGYLSHAANFAYTFAFFTARGWTVVTLDLPGHGLSEGPRGDIGSFAEYGDAVATWMNWVWKQNWPGPRWLMAHSLGATSSFEALGRRATPRPDQVIFISPLLRPVWYWAATLGDALVGWSIPYVSSLFTSDRYLDGYAMPVHWFQALEKWLETLDQRPPQRLPLTVYAGTRDNVADTSWNLSEFRRLVPNARLFVLPGESHLFVTGKKERDAFHERLAADLGL